MKKIAVIYWSNMGNVEILADKIGKGAKDSGAEVVLKHVKDAKVEDVLSADGVAFGSPSLYNNKVEQTQMVPFINQFKGMNNSEKKVVLFGSYGWDEGQFIKDWKVTMEDLGFNIVGELAVREAPTEDDIKKAEDLGKLLVK